MLGANIYLIQHKDVYIDTSYIRLTYWNRQDNPCDRSLIISFLLRLFRSFKDISPWPRFMKQTNIPFRGKQF